MRVRHAHAHAHVNDSSVVPGTHHVDPDCWDPLIMTFCELHGGSTRLCPSRLA